MYRVVIERCLVALTGRLKAIAIMLFLVTLAVISNPSFAEGNTSIREGVLKLSIHKWNTLYSATFKDSYPNHYIQMQIKAESAYKIKAVSPVGAKGLGQFMPNTWEDMKRELGMEGERADVFNPDANVQATVYYMYKLRGIYKTPRPDYERHSMALCSYNAGAGNCIKAQKLCSNTLYWTEAKECLHLVTGHHNIETKNYVSKIWVWIREEEDATTD